MNVLPRFVPALPHSAARTLALLSLAALPGCASALTGSTQEVAGIAGAGIASSITRSATAATAIGLAVAAGANAGLQYEERVVHRAEQDRIAEAAGGLEAGAAIPWSVSHDVPVEADEHGQVAVVRGLGGAAVECKDIVFSVDTSQDHQPERAFYTATICHDGARWKWATAEPATERWGALQ